MSKRILVIDDDQDILDIIELILKEDGYEIIVSRSGNILGEVLEIRPDLILLDDWLADKQGHELCKMLKTEWLTCKIPIVMISAVQGLKQISVDCMADSYIEKPFDIADLSDVVASLIAKVVESEE